MCCFLALMLCASTQADEKPLASVEELQQEVEAASTSGDAATLWLRIVAHKMMPLIFGDRAFFFWRGEANVVEWRGDFNFWESSADSRGKRIGKTDIWMYERTFPLDSRLDYKLVVNEKDWQLDPLNPNTQLGGYGPNSEVRMPDWRPSGHAVRRLDTVRGTFSKDIPFQSKKTGYTIHYRVYTPAGFDPAKSKNLPVLYVTDGSDYWNDEMGSLVITLDNLITDKKIAPVLAVFIDPWDREANVNRREKEFIPAEDRSCLFCEFLVEELIPTIDAAYPTNRNREGRAIVGASYGGLHAGLMALRSGSLFGMIGVQSPAFRPAPWVLEELARAEVLPAKAFITTGTFERGHIIESASKLREILKSRRVDVQYHEVHDGHSWGNWRALLDDMLVFFYPR